MLRVVLTIVLPLLLPTFVYLLWMWIVRRHRAALPWIWLAGAGVVLLAAVLLIVTVGFGTTAEGVYVPPRWEKGRIVPGHVEPGRSTRGSGS